MGGVFAKPDAVAEEGAAVAAPTAKSDAVVEEGAAVAAPTAKPGPVAEEGAAAVAAPTPLEEAPDGPATKKEGRTGRTKAKKKEPQPKPVQQAPQKPPQGRPGGSRPRRTSEAFDAFYKVNLVGTGLIEAGAEWERFIDCLNRPLPSSLWITPTAKDAEEVRGVLQDYQQAVEALRAEQPSGSDAPSDEVPLQLAPLSWMPNDMGWRVDVPKAVLRKDPKFRPLHRMLIEHTAKGTINRMEEVSMLPVAFLDVGAGHRCLDMCASPGNKTAQMLSLLAEANFKKSGRGLEDITSSKVQNCQPFLRGRVDYSSDEGFVIANDLSVERSGMLVHQIARHQSLYPLVVFTSHDARFFPSIRSPEGAEVRFDRILCDVMCSSDGTLRKSPHLWREWTPKTSHELHNDQLAVALRAARLLKVGGRMVYSTCSMSPIEDEAVVAELLRRTQGSLVLVDARKTIDPLRTCEGLRQWQVAHPGTRQMFSTYAAAVEADGAHKLLCPGNFPPDMEATLSSELPKCIRILPHHNDTSGFFISVFDKVADIKRSTAAEEHAYDSDVDEDGEEVDRRRQLERLEEAVTQGRSEQDVAKALGRRERAKNSGSLARELAIYTQVVDDMPEQAASLRYFYGLHASFPMHLLFCRYQLELNSDGAQVRSHLGEANTLIFCAKGVADVLMYGTGEHARRKLKIMAGGLRAFEKDRFEVAERSSEFRFAQEALEFMLPYLSERVVDLEDPADMRRLFDSASKRTAPTAALVSPAVQSKLEALSPGGCALLLRSTSTAQGGCSRVAVSALRTQKAVNLYISDLVVPALRKACGLPAEEVLSADLPADDDVAEGESADLPADAEDAEEPSA